MCRVRLEDLGAIVEASAVLREIGMDPDAGVKLEVQIRDYDPKMKPWSRSDREGKKRGEALLDCAVQVLTSNIGTVHNSKSMAELQKNLIVYNVNEFRLRLQPTEQEFKDILVDFGNHAFRTKKCWVGPQEKLQKVSDLLDKVLEAAWLKHHEISQTAQTTWAN